MGCHCLLEITYISSNNASPFMYCVFCFLEFERRNKLHAHLWKILGIENKVCLLVCMFSVIFHSYRLVKNRIVFN